MNYLQILRSTAGAINNSANVIFDKIIKNTGNIAYDTSTGSITILENGTYIVDWWVSTLSSTAQSIIFTLQFTNNSVISTSLVKTSTTGGISILEITDAPVSGYLVNSSGSSVYLPGNIPNTADMRLFSIATPANNLSACFERNQLVYLLLQLTKLYPGADAAVLLDGYMGELNVQLQSLYTAPGSGLATFLVTTTPEGPLYFDINTISSIKLTNAVYNNEISYLPLPEHFVENCDTAIISAMHSLLTLNANVNFYMNNAYGTSGNVFRNEYGMVVLAPAGGSNPQFIVPSKSKSVIFY